MLNLFQIYMRHLALIIGSLLILALSSGCGDSTNVTPNPWLVEFQNRHGSPVSHSQMRAMLRLAYTYRDHGMEAEYIHALTTGVELYAGDMDVTTELINYMIGRINETNLVLKQHEGIIERYGIDKATLTDDSVQYIENGADEAKAYLATKKELETEFEECYRILSMACGQLPYNTDFYYRTAQLQYIRAEQDGDPEKYRDAINFLKRAIATKSWHLESYHLIAQAYEKLGDNRRALRFWKQFEVIYEVAPQTLGEGVITDEIREMHGDAVRRIAELEGEIDDR